MTVLSLLGLVCLGLFLLWLGYLLGKAVTRARLSDDVTAIRQDAIKRSRAVIGGQVSEQLAPFLPDFPWRPTEARFIGKPIDFLIFKGLDGKEIEEVVFVEVKTGESRLSGVERSLRDAIAAGKVTWAEYRAPRKDGLRET